MGDAADAAAGELARLRGGLRAVGSVLGFEVVVTDDDEWTAGPDGLRVGLGWYAVRGHGEREALALALLQIWEGPRDALREPARSRRRRTLERRQPEAAPLLAAVARLQAVAEVLSAMPGMRGPLSAALLRGLPPDVASLPRHLQWVGLLLSRGAGLGAGAGAEAEAGAEAPGDAGLDELVRSEWSRLLALGGDGVDPLRRALAPTQTAAALRRFERAVALLLPPYDRLLAADLAERGLATDGGEAAADTTRDPEAPPLGAEGAGGGSADADAASEATADDDASGEGSDDRARRGEGRQSAEGSDLFAAEQAGFTRRALPTPLPGGGAAMAALLELAQEARATGGDDSREPSAAGAAGTGGAGVTPPDDYRRRVAELAGEIERMRLLWQRVIAERIAPRRTFDRLALPDGDVLATSHLASAVAEARAGIPRPHAFHRRIERPRRTRGAGSTDYVLLVDRSASMQGPIAEAAADAMLVMVESLAGVDRDISHRESQAGIGLGLDVRTSLIAFDAQPEVLKPLSHGIDDAVRLAVHFATRSPRGSTNDGAALRAAAEQLCVGGAAGDAVGAPTAETERRRIVILVSDGGSNDAIAAARELRRLRAAGVHVHGIGIGGDEVAQRYAPLGHRIDEARAITAAIEAIVEAELRV